MTLKTFLHVLSVICVIVTLVMGTVILAASIQSARQLGYWNYEAKVCASLGLLVSLVGLTLNIALREVAPWDE